jgi:hypothetical protein
MDLKGAIVYIQKWRLKEGLGALSPQEERESASKLLFEKGYKLPEVFAGMKLSEGVYIKTVGEAEEAGEEEGKQGRGELIAPLFPWEPQDSREFWCEKLGSFVRMTNDLNSDGTYWVIKSGEGHFRRYPVRGNELVPKENAPSNAPIADLLLINSAAWADIKNCLVDKFIPSYPWAKNGDKSPTQVREDMLTLAKSRKRGLAQLIEDERKAARFEDAQVFMLRMNAVHESFPWGDFAQMLDFN